MTETCPNTQRNVRARSRLQTPRHELVPPAGIVANRRSVFNPPAGAPRDAEPDFASAEPRATPSSLNQSARVTQLAHLGKLFQKRGPVHDGRSCDPVHAGAVEMPALGNTTIPRKVGFEFEATAGWQVDGRQALATTGSPSKTLSVSSLYGPTIAEDCRPITVWRSGYPCRSRARSA